MYCKTVSTLLTIAAIVSAVQNFHDARSLVSSRQADGAPDASAFLRRAYHASAVLNGRVYIDGGEFSYQNANDIVYEYSNMLLSIDLTKDWTNDSVPLASVPKPPGVPNLSHGGIWAARRKGTLYTGFAGTNPHFGDHASSPQGLWSFEPGSSAGNSWKCLNGSTDGWFTSQPRPSQGQAASGGGYGFFLGGNGTEDQRSSGTFVMYDMPGKKITNIPAPGPSSRRPPNYVGTTYVPNWGRKGILVAVGGGSQSERDGNNGQVTFQTVRIYDVDEQRWYEQQSTGDIPEPRKDFCIAGSPSNNRTHEILVYAGWTGQLGSGAIPYDSACVLTLPGFYWAKADYPATHPRHGLTCNAVGGSQILILGGVDTTQDGNDSYAAGFTTRDPFTRGLAIFDLGVLGWSSVYSAGRSLQPPAPKIKAYYDVNGRAPEQGFANSDLQTLLSNYKPSPDDPNPKIHPPPSSTHPGTATIIGGVIGSAAGAGLIAWVVVYSLLRRRRRRSEREQQRRRGDGTELTTTSASASGFDGLLGGGGAAREAAVAAKMGITGAKPYAVGSGSGSGSGTGTGAGDWEGGFYRGVIPTRAAIALVAAGAGSRWDGGGRPAPVELDSRPVHELEAAGVPPPAYELEGDSVWPSLPLLPPPPPPPSSSPSVSTPPSSMYKLRRFGRRSSENDEAAKDASPSTSASSSVPPTL